MAWQVATRYLIRSSFGRNSTIEFSRYKVEPGRITAQFFGSEPTDMEVREEIVHKNVTEDFPLIDEFEVLPKPAQLAKSFVTAPRTYKEILAAYDWDAIVADTRIRNSQHFHA